MKRRWIHRRALIATGAVLVTIALGVGAYPKICDWFKMRAERLQAESEPALREKIVSCWKENRAALNTLAFDAEIAAQSNSHAMSYTTRDRERVRQMTEDSTNKTTCRYRCRGNWVKKESIAKDDPDFGLVILSREMSHVTIYPRIKQAWLSIGRADADSAEAIDPRCAGFPPSFSDLGTWLEECIVDSIAMMSARRIVRLRGTSKSPQRGSSDFIVDFDPAQRYLPVTVVFMYPGGSTISSIAALEYQPVKSGAALFLKRERVRYFLNGTPKDPERTSPSLVVETVVQGEPNTEVTFAPNEFDPIVPPKTLLVGNLAIESVSPDEPVPALRLTLKSPVFLRQIK